MTTLAQPKAPAPPRLVAHLTNDVVSVYCPGCELDHRFYVGPRRAPDGSGGDIGYNGRHTAGPTFSAALSTRKHCQLADVPFCAFTVIAGKIAFAADCEHPLKSKAVALPPFPADFWRGGKVPDLPINRQKMP